MDQVSVVIDGLEVDGFGPESSCQIAYRSQAFALIMGSTGTGTRSKSNDRSARITLTLQIGAAANVGLSVKHVTDFAANSGGGPLQITDRSTGTTHSAKRAWVVQHPTVDYGRTAPTKQWVLETDELITNHLAVT